MAKYEIRSIAISDWPKLKSIRLRALKNDPDAFGSAYAFESMQGDAYWQDWAAGSSVSGRRLTALAQSNQTDIGMGGAKREGHAVEIVALWVDPGFRRIGVALRILDFIRNVMPASSHFLWVNANHAAAIALYARAGFRDTGMRQSLPRDPNVLEMKMEIGAEIRNQTR